VSYQRYQRGKEQHTTTNVDNEGENEFLEVERKKERSKGRVNHRKQSRSYNQVCLLTVTVAKLLGQVTLKGATFTPNIHFFP